MNCRRVQTLLPDHVEGLLSEHEAGAVGAHLDHCSGCRRRRDEFSAVQHDLQGLAELGSPPHLARRAIDHWATQQDAVESHPGRWFCALPAIRVLAPPSARRVLLSAAAATVLVILGLTLSRKDHTDRGGHSPSPLAAQPGPSRLLPVTGGTLHSAETRSHGGERLTGGRGDGATGRQGEKTAELAPSLRPLVAPSPKRPVAVSAPPPPAALVRMREPSHRADDLEYVNGNPIRDSGRWVRLSKNEADRIEAQVREQVRVKDDFVTIPFPRLADVSNHQIAAAVESYKREAAIIDPRLAREVTLQFKATALSDLCDHLRSETGISLVTGRSVPDEKVTFFCKRMPLRDVMRQLSRPFGYTWVRSTAPPTPSSPAASAPAAGEAREYRYELMQDLRSQLLEEELRNRDRHAALLALEREMDRYRPYLPLSPDEALAREKTAAPAERKLLHHLANKGWGPVQMYSRLSRSDMEALRSGQRLFFSQDPQPGHRPLPSDIARGVLQAWRDSRIVKRDDGFGSTGGDDPNGLPLTAVPEVRAWIYLEMRPSEGGNLLLDGVSGWFTPRNLPRRAAAYDPDDLNGLAAANNPTTRTPENAVVNARSAGDPALRPRISVRPDASYPGADRQIDVSSIPTPESAAPRSDQRSSPEKKVTSADVLEALHQATGLPIVGDAYTRLYPQAAVSVKNQPLFAALNQLGDTMRLRWNKDGTWLQFRSTTFYEDRLKEVPNRLLMRWAASRRKHGFLPLDDLCEIAQLSEAQLAAADMAEGAQYCWGLTEWVLFRNHWRRPVWRFLAEFTPAQRQKITSSAGLPFTEMSLPQQQRFLSFASIASFYEEDAPLQSLQELEGAALRVKYTVPGWFEWRPPGPWWTEWVVVLEPGRQGRRVLRPLVVERTREAALQAARQQFPMIREAALRWARQADPDFDAAQLVLQESQIVPTELFLAVVQMPGASNRRHLISVTSHYMGFSATW